MSDNQRTDAAAPDLERTIAATMYLYDSQGRLELVIDGAGRLSDTLYFEENPYDDSDRFPAAAAAEGRLAVAYAAARWAIAALLALRVLSAIEERRWRR